MFIHIKNNFYLYLCENQPKPQMIEEVSYESTFVEKLTSS